MASQQKALLMILSMTVLYVLGVVSLRAHLLPDNSKDLIFWANKRAIDYFQIIDANSVELKTIVENSRRTAVGGVP